jgi:hypothetical protein
MKRRIFSVGGLVSMLLVVLLSMFLVAAPIGGQETASARHAQSQDQKKEVTVWVNTNSGVYHCPETRWYGKTKHGKYMGECEAQKEGYRPAYGKPCGSDCR